jgi:serine/threonine protein phosphatase 1
MATYVIGDIHNNIKGLEEVLEKAPLVVGDTLIFIGDYFDGWKYAKEVAELLMNIQTTYECIFIMGNHDEWVLDWLKTGDAKSHWLKQGGQHTYDSLSAWFEDEPQRADELMFFLENCKYYYHDDQDRVFVHGGYESNEGIGHDSNEVYTWNRSLIYHVNDREEAPKRLKAHKEVYVGHTSTTFWNTTEPLIKHNLINVDTGSGWDGCLTIMNIDTKEYWQSKKSKIYYPEDIGR